MKKAELERKIREMGIPPSEYSLDGETVYGVILDKMMEKDWYRVYSLDERGGHHGEKYFPSEDEACDYMYELIRPNGKILDVKGK